MARKSVLRIELEALTSKLVSGFKQGEQASRSLKAELGKT